MFFTQTPPDWLWEKRYNPINITISNYDCVF